MEKGNRVLISIERRIVKWIAVIAIIVPFLVAVLLFMPSRLNLLSDWVYFLPRLNAVINSATSIVLIAGLVFIKNGKISLHKAAMTIAMVLGAIFLISYVIFHASAESTSFGGEGWIRTLYYFTLISHIILAAVALFPILIAYYYGITDQLDKHRKIVKYAFPVWLYVSISGVIVYLMISPYYNF